MSQRYYKSIFWMMLFTLLSCEDNVAPVSFEGPILSASNPMDLGESPIGVRVQNAFLFTNTGNAELHIMDLTLSPDEGNFQVGITQFPTKIGPLESLEVTITFFPQEIKPYEAELTLHYNHNERESAPPPIILKGVGVTNLVCKACAPPPQPECALGGQSSIYFEPTTSDSCESEAGICAYLVFETLCEHGECDETTGLCPPEETLDAGVPGNESDAGVSDDNGDAGVPDDDGDADGIIDADDNCPTTSNADQTDTDSDGTGDACDLCPDDTNKTEPGICGCSVADTDTDSDGTPDCNDECDNDPAKTEAGVCGCDVADTDTDSDGTPDCNDACDNDPAKTEAGVCGCGVADIDADDDGVMDCLCTVQCDNKDCGDDGCGGVCGTCSGETPHCSYASKCVGSPDLWLEMENLSEAQTFVDSSTNAFTVTAHGDALQTSGGVGEGSGHMTLDGTGDYLGVDAPAVRYFGSSDFTIETWVRFHDLPPNSTAPPSSHYIPIMVAGNGVLSSSPTASSAWFIMLSPGSANPEFILGSYSCCVAAYAGHISTGALPLTTDTWYHLAFTRSGSTLRAFLDGVLTGEVTTSHNFIDLAQPIHIGGNFIFIANNVWQPNYLNGDMDDVKIYNGISLYDAAFDDYFQ